MPVSWPSIVLDTNIFNYEIRFTFLYRVCPAKKVHVGPSELMAVTELTDVWVNRALQDIQVSFVCYTCFVAIARFLFSVSEFGQMKWMKYLEYLILLVNVCSK